MSWRARLAEIAIAGGMVSGCGSGIPGGSCNANPDPCCPQPDGPACQAQLACEAEPTVSCCFHDQSFTASCMAPKCDGLANNDFDGAGPLTRSGTTCSANPAIGCYGQVFDTDIEREGTTAPSPFLCDTPAPGNENLRHGAPAGPSGVSDGQACAQGYAATQIDSPTGPTWTCFALCSPGNAYLGNPLVQLPNGLSPHGCNSVDAVGAFGTPASATDNGEHCVFAWRFGLTAAGVHDVPTNDHLGLCLDHTKLKYSSRGDGFLDTPWPSCASQPLHGDPASHIPDATQMGCVTTTTGGISIVAAAAPLAGLPGVPALRR